MILKVNVQDLPNEQSKGVTPARLAIRSYVNKYDGWKDPRKRHYSWLSDSISPKHDVDSDESWAEKGYATITPISIDITYGDYLNKMRQDTAFGGQNGTLREE